MSNARRASFSARKLRDEPEFSPVGTAIVVSIAAHVRRTDRYSVTLEDEAGVRTTIMLSDEYVVRHSLRDADQLDESRTLDLLNAAGCSTAFDRATSALAVRGRSIRELEQWLFHRGVQTEHAKYAVDRLARLGLLDDARFASAYVRSRVTGRGASVWSLRQDLARKGVAREVADQAISEVLGEIGTDDLSMARREGERKWRTLARVDATRAMQRLVAYLRRRGFSGGIALEVARDLLRERGSIA